MGKCNHFGRKTNIARNLYESGEAFIPGILHTGHYDTKSIRCYNGSPFVIFDDAEHLFKTLGSLHIGRFRAIKESTDLGAIVLLLTT